MNPALEELFIARLKELSRPMSPQPTGQVARGDAFAGVRAVLFDVYGTLLISGTGDVGVSAGRARGELVQDALASASLNPRPGAGQAGLEGLGKAIHASHRASRSRGVDVPEVDIRLIWRDVLQGLAKGNLISWNGEADPVSRMAVEYEARVNPVWPMPGAAALLSELVDRMPVGIVSNAQFYTPMLFPALFEKSLNDWGVEESLCAWSYRLGAAKPSARMFAGVLNELAQREIHPHETLYIGNDMLNDVWTAREAGCRTALFAGDARSLRLREEEPRCKGLCPDAVLAALRP